MPDLHTLLNDPSAVLQLATEERTALRVKVAALAAALDACPAAGPLPAKAEVSAGKNGLLTPKEVAARLRTTRKWVYRHADELQAKHLSRKCLRIPACEIERLLRATGA
jgi:hypothetical protein